MGWLLAQLFLPADSRRRAYSDFTTPRPLPPGSTLVAGVVGGWEHRDAPQRLVPP